MPRSRHRQEAECREVFRAASRVRLYHARGAREADMLRESLAELVRFAPDVYGFRWVNHVAMFVVTSAGVVLVDANGQVNPRTPSLIKEAIRSVTAQPVRYFVYSHSAFDHSTGGAVFSDTAEFVGHRNTV